MPAPSITLAQILKLDPCKDRYDAAKSKLPARKSITAAAAREAGISFGDVVWVLSAMSRTDKDVERRLRLWMSDCAARVLHIFEGEQPADLRPREAICAVRAYARGEIDAAAWAATREAAWEAAWAAARDTASAAASAAAWAAAWAAARDAASAAAWAAARDAASAAAWAAARDAASAAAWAAVWAAAREAAWAAARDAASAAAWAAVWAAAREAERNWQFDRLIARMSENDLEDWPLPLPAVAKPEAS
jgi:hypothetical protein